MIVKEVTDRKLPLLVTHGNC
ncbi:hypothetical protein BO443_60293 [Burkholderia orbicola]